MATNRWLRPEVYPLFAAVGVAIGICGLQLVRNMRINPEVRVSKEKRAAGVLDNFEEGQKYAEHAVRKFARSRPPEIFPSLNRFFSDPQKN
ncbi:uncharacterized protein LOC107786096 [Nicotiana tabacum]|uniref:Uncharacterized protein LOC107786096 n=3 Tax=Nicotiana TaxID=4085 RepID=A0A1S3ZFF9_TOBAC|nr:PREDICTED: uncharacterized protein LOC104233674 [Nicotiana sylvestris]XP_016463021.1 PREDICTED: uncharacterized protein LOC107786096 [Nicotiana tabacum]XP_019237439.1 PREDICTED: uncharacterized protein LOC109217627 [Nicotiana attenuata]OIT22417.1 hypothetical protein A4A49_30942 [Nicotiana attenuata]